MQVFRIWVAVGAVVGAAAVGMAAYAAHAAVDPARARSLASAVQMQGWHALALVAVGLFGLSLAGGGWAGGALVHAAGGLFLAGLVLFCGAVYVPLFGGPGLGMVAPVGGSLLILGWLAFAVAALRG
jgi:uncharacterized membrane protein YgdD (TMEM256/DUF423 family)